MPKSKEYFSIYIKDHDTLLSAALQIAERHMEHSEWDMTDALEPMLANIRNERDALQALMARHGLEHSKLTDAMTWLAERFGRLKLNGHLLTRSPLSEVTELEALSLCAEARRLFWKSLEDTPAWTQLPPNLETFENNALVDHAQCSSLHAMSFRRALSMEPDQENSMAKKVGASKDKVSGRGSVNVK